MDAAPMEVGGFTLVEVIAIVCILSMLASASMLLLSGALRRAERPKRKKNKHVRPKPILFPELAQKLRAGQAVNNGELRRALGQVQAGTTTPTDKEGCGIVQE